MKFDLSPFLPYLVTICIGLIVWFYNLIEKRINARADEAKALEKTQAEQKGDIERLKIKVELLEKSHEKMFEELKTLIVDKMDFLEKLFNEKLKNK